MYKSSDFFFRRSSQSIVTINCFLDGSLLAYLNLICCSFFSFVSGAFIRRIGIGIIIYRKETQKWLALRLHYRGSSLGSMHTSSSSTGTKHTAHYNSPFFSLFFGFRWWTGFCPFVSRKHVVASAAVLSPFFFSGYVVVGELDFFSAHAMGQEGLHGVFDSLLLWAGSAPFFMIPLGWAACWFSYGVFSIQPRPHDI